MTLEDKCEHLMNIVVESRKRFGKMCIDYEQKTSLVENKILNLQIETISNYRFKSKTTVPSVDFEGMEKELDEFKDTLINNEKRIHELRRNLLNTQNVVMQLKTDGVGQRLKKPLTAEAMLADAKKKLKS
ncbi:unnamed protein product [Euphydryas editha]|uniref:Uncharacterized protein n=1 Tax=Euphydryas editha TaxID=104508 RepID=A0AAU9UPT0_EUPED|nr:unnamed protein product [Euphydryas editha]